MVFITNETVLASVHDDPWVGSPTGWNHPVIWISKSKGFGSLSGLIGIGVGKAVDSSDYHMGVSKNNDTPKSSIFKKVFHYFHHPFWGFLETPISKSKGFLLASISFKNLKTTNWGPENTWLFHNRDPEFSWFHGQIIIFHQPRFPWNKGMFLH